MRDKRFNKNTRIVGRGTLCDADNFYRVGQVCLICGYRVGINHHNVFCNYVKPNKWSEITI